MTLRLVRENAVPIREERLTAVCRIADLAQDYLAIEGLPPSARREDMQEGVLIEMRRELARLETEDPDRGDGDGCKANATRPSFFGRRTISWRSLLRWPR